jgi:hypothetical protein
MLIKTAALFHDAGFINGVNEGMAFGLLKSYRNLDTQKKLKS